MQIENVTQIVREAAELFKNRNFDVEQKSSISDRVTSIDIAVEKFLKEKLTNLLKGSGFLGEESDAHQIDNEYVWVVDPIDGTTNFIRNLKISCVSVALLKDKQAVLAVVYNPYRDEMFTAQKGEGAYLNGKKISTSHSSFEGSLYFTSLSPYTKHEAKVSMDILTEVYENCDDMRRMGSAAYELCLLACGRGDMYFEIRLQPWDFAGGALILQEGGGYACIPNEDTITYDGVKAFMGANNKENFDRLRGIVEKHLKSEK